MTFNIIDVVITVILILFGIAGFKKGLVGNIVGFVSLIASFVLGWILYPVIADILVGLGVRDGIYGMVMQNVNVMPEGGISAWFLTETMTEAVNTSADAAVLQVTGSITDIILNIVSFLIVMVVSRVIIFIGEKMLKIAVKLPVLNGLNRIGGIIVGFIKGVILVSVLSMIIVAVYPMGRESEAVKNSYFIEKFCYNNPVVRNMIEEEQSEFNGTENVNE